MKRALFCLLFVATAPHAAQATGLLIPKDTSLPPLAIESHRVNVTIDNQVATTKVEQVFINHTSRNLEAKYIFPLPRNAAILDFAMTINGKRVSGELVEKDKARQVYQQIVARMRDPGLLEYMGNNLFRVNIFPVPAHGRQKIELRYSQVLTQDSGATWYRYPLRTGEKASTTMKDFSMGVTITSQVAIKNVYSPTHEIGVSKKGEHKAVAGFEISQARLDKDFELYYTVSDKDFGLNLITYRTDVGQPGYFMMLISPKSRINADEVVQRDVSFVFDTSGSMRGDKIEQAKRAMKHCIDRLNPGDRFNVIPFSTDVEPWAETMQEATDENRAAVRAFIDKLAAQGGTNIDAALAAALQHEPKKNRPHVVIFLTDGLPTIGITEKDAIVKHVLEQRKGTLRIFSFGVGPDVNTHLLDAISGQSGGVTEYVRNDEKIDDKVARFYDKASHPVLTNLDLAIDKVKITQMYPRELPDLYHGSQLVVLGRYDKSGHVSVRLTGQVNDKTETFVYESTFAEKTGDHAFIEPIWANRKVGYLLDAIRLNGEKKELVDEVVALSKRYGIQTPYTSYLVLESDDAFARHGIRPPQIARRGQWNHEQRSRSSGFGGGGGMGGGGLGGGLGGGMRGGSGLGGGLDGFGLRPAFAGRAARPGDASAQAPRREAERLKTSSYARAALRRQSSRMRRMREQIVHLRDHNARRSLWKALDEAGVPVAGATTEGLNRQAFPADRPVATDGIDGDSRTLRSFWEARFLAEAPVVNSSPVDLRAESGEAAVRAAEVLRKLKEQNRTTGKKEDAYVFAGLPSRKVGSRMMVRVGSVWVDSRFDAGAAVVKVKYASDAYFKLFENRKDLREVFKLGPRLVIVTARGKALVIDDRGAETLEPKAVAALFVDAPTREPPTGAKKP